MVTLVGPGGSLPQDALLDTAADDTVFPQYSAQFLGIDLANAPVGTAKVIGGAVVQVRYAEVVLRIADQNESREWKTWVAFAQGRMPFALLGFAGFLEFYSATFDGANEVVELTVNKNYPGI
jgi:hypothetical protein